MQKRRAVFLDRDGVLNEPIMKYGKPHSPASISELVINTEAGEACSRLKEAGFALILITNQPNVKRGITTRESVEKINQIICERLHLDDCQTCYHDDDDNCDCRKPRPGMLLKASEIWNIDLDRSFMIGDRCKDIIAGRRAGCKTIFIDNQYPSEEKCSADFQTQSLLTAADWIMQPFSHTNQ